MVTGIAVARSTPTRLTTVAKSTMRSYGCLRRRHGRKAREPEVRRLCSIGSGVAERNMPARHPDRLFRRFVHPADLEFVAIDLDDQALPPARTIDIRLCGEHHRAGFYLRPQRVGGTDCFGREYVCPRKDRLGSRVCSCFDGHPAFYQHGELVECGATGEWHEGSAGSEDSAERQLLGNLVQLRILGWHADDMKAHQLGGAQHEGCIALVEARRMRLVVDIDAEHHDNRQFFAHLRTSHRERLASRRSRRAHGAAREHNRNARHMQHILCVQRNYSRFTCKAVPSAGFSGTCAQLAKAGQSVCWHWARSSMRRPLQRFSPASAQNRQIACWTNRGKFAGKAGLNWRASILPAMRSMIAAQPPGA